MRTLRCSRRRKRAHRYAANAVESGQIQICTALLRSESRLCIGTGFGRSDDIPMFCDPTVLNPEKVGDRVRRSSRLGIEAHVQDDHVMVGEASNHLPTRTRKLAYISFQQFDRCVAVPSGDVRLMVDEIGRHESFERAANILLDQRAAIEVQHQEAVRGLARVTARWRASLGARDATATTIAAAITRRTPRSQGPNYIAPGLTSVWPATSLGRFRRSSPPRR